MSESDGDTININDLENFEDFDVDAEIDFQIIRLQTNRRELMLYSFVFGGAFYKPLFFNSNSEQNFELLISVEEISLFLLEKEDVQKMYIYNYFCVREDQLNQFDLLRQW